MTEEYAKVGGGWAFAVVMRRGRVRRMHDTRSLDGVLAEWAKGGVLVFAGVPDGDTAPATYAGGLRADDIAGIGYWTPHDDEPETTAYESAGVLFQAVVGALGFPRVELAPAEDEPVKIE